MLYHRSIRKPKTFRSILGTLGILLLLSGCGAPTTPQGATGASHGSGDAAAVDFPHIHGLGFSADGRQLLVPAHTGLRIFTEGHWQVPDVPARDYMGYTPTDSGFYSSGHPGATGDEVNPLGLVKSTDGGKTLGRLGFEGESDFHLMGVGYTNHTIYVLNPTPNSKLSVGLHYSLDDGKTWQKSAAHGLTSQPVQIAVHPTRANVVATATEGGLLLSADHGDTFARIGPAELVTAASFSPGGEKVLFATTRLFSYDLAHKQVTGVQTPRLPEQDAISHIAVSPVRDEEIAIATFGRNIYLSNNGGQSWKQIARDGKGI